MQVGASTQLTSVHRVLHLFVAFLNNDHSLDIYFSTPCQLQVTIPDVLKLTQQEDLRHITALVRRAVLNDPKQYYGLLRAIKTSAGLKRSVVLCWRSCTCQHSNCIEYFHAMPVVVPVVPSRLAFMTLP